MSGSRYLELLSASDLALLASAAGEVEAGRLRAAPDSIETLLARPSVHAALFAEAPDALVRMSPFLAFSAFIARAAAELGERAYVEEWSGPGRRMPVFDVDALREFVANRARRLFLVELLASYTRVTSGSFLVRTSRGWRRRRYSDLDPLRLAELLEVAPERDRPAIYRRLGDLALFLSGVFPDHAGSAGIPPRHVRRLAGLLAEPGGARVSSGLAAILGGEIGTFEWLGRRSYQLAHDASAASGAAAPLLADVANRFSTARRVVNFVTDRYLFPVRERWFGLGA